MFIELIEKLKKAICIYKNKILEINNKILLNSKSVNYKQEVNRNLNLLKIDIEMIYYRLISELNELKYLNTKQIIRS